MNQITSNSGLLESMKKDLAKNTGGGLMNTTATSGQPVAQSAMKPKGQSPMPFNDGADPRNPAVTPLPKVVNPVKMTAIPGQQPAPKQPGTQQPIGQQPVQPPVNDGPASPSPSPLPPVKNPLPIGSTGADQTMSTTGVDFSKIQSPYSAGNSTANTNSPARYEAQNGSIEQSGLVENRLAGLMDSNNPLMKKSIVNANNLSAQRGLQSSSIATENGINSMFNYALPIAQQDAQTVTNQNLANQDRQAQVGMQDNQALNQQAINEAQNRFTATESAVQRDFTAEFEKLKNENSQGLLNQEGQLRLVEMERQSVIAKDQMQYSAGIQSQRDALLQNFQQQNMDTEFVNQLEAMEQQSRLGMAAQNNQNNFARQMEYSNAISNATNFGIEALGNAFMNPEITPDQYPAIQANIMQMIQSQIANFQDIYGITTEGVTGSNADNPGQGPVQGVGGPNIGPVQPGQGGGLMGGGGGTVGGPSNGFRDVVRPPRAPQ